MSLLEHLPVLLIVTPLLTSPILAMLVKYPKTVRSIYSILTIICLLISITIMNNSQSMPAIYQVGGWKYNVGISFLINQYSASMALILSVSFFITSFGFIIYKKLNPSTMVFSSLIFVGLCGMCITADFFNLYVFIELSSIASYVLVSFNNTNKSSLKVSFDYLIIGSVAGMLVLLGIFLIYSACGHLSMIELTNKLSTSTQFSQNQILLMKHGYLIMIAGFILKAGVYPLHITMVKTYSTSTPVISAFMSSTATKVYVFMIYKIGSIFYKSLYASDIVQHLSDMLIILSAIGSIAMGLSNIGERNLKKEISISSMIQICYFTIGFSTFNSTIITGTIIQMFIHSVAISTIFLTIEPSMYNIDTNYSPKHARETPKYFITNSITSQIGVIFLLLTIAGYPLTSGFLTKWLMLNGLLKQNHLILIISIIVSSGIGMLYTWRIIERIVLFKHHYKAFHDKHIEDSTTKSKKNIIPIIIFSSIIATLTFGTAIFKQPFTKISKGINYFDISKK